MPTTTLNGTASALPTDVATLQAQLRLARAQNADMHRQLQGRTHGTAPAPTPPTTAPVPLGYKGPEGNASLEAENAQLRARLAKAEATFREQQGKYAALSAAYEEERKSRIKHEHDHEYWFQAFKTRRDQVVDLEDQLKRAGIEPRPNYQWLDRGPSQPDLIASLRQLGHPDKWSQGQPATELAHELMVYLNNLRSRP